MSQVKQTAFNWRGFTSITAALSFLGLACTGTVLFFMPPGRIANWTGWTWAGLTKHQWGGLHIWCSILFVVICAIHIIFNWKILLNYFKDKTRQHLALRGEWILSLILCSLLFAGTIKSAAPFAAVQAWQESIKSSYDRLPAQAPIPHAELLTLDELATEVEGADATTLRTNLEAEGIVLNSPDETIGALAERYNKTPAQIYQLASGKTFPVETRGQGQRGGRGQGQGPHGPGAGGGGGGQRFGQMTLKDYCLQMGLDVTLVLENLRNAGYTASETMVMRDIASSAGVHPSELRGMLE